MNKEKLDSLKLLKQEELIIGMEVSQLGEIGKKDKTILALRKYIITQEDIDSNTGMYYLDTRRSKTISKTFYDREIQARLPDGSLYLKMGVKRKHYGDDLNYDEMHQLIQDEGIYQMSQLHKKLKKDEEY